MKSEVYVFWSSTSPIYFSFKRIRWIDSVLHVFFPEAVRIPLLSSSFLMETRLSPSRNRCAISRIVSASSGTISGFPSNPLRYPRKFAYRNVNRPCRYPIRIPFVTFPLIDSLSACAKELRQVRIISLFIFAVLIFSFSKMTGIPQLLRMRTCLIQSSVLRANREIDFVRIRSIFFFLHSSIISLNCSRFLVLTPLIPSSAKIPASCQPSWCVILSV